MARNIGTINTSQTFQNWFDKTNDLVEELRDNIITASSGGDSTTGDATLVGDFTATNLIAGSLLSADDISSSSGGVINFQDPIQITGTSATTATFLFAGTGGQTRYTDGNLSWDVGLESSNPGHFIIDTGTGQSKFELSVAGTLTVPNLIVTDVISANTISLGGGGSGLSTDDISEGSTNLYYLDSRARAAFTGGDGIDVSSSGVISFDGTGKLDTYEGDSYILAGSVDVGDKAYLAGKQSSGAPVGLLKTETASTDKEVLLWDANGIEVNGGADIGGTINVKSGSAVVAYIDASGNGLFTGDVTTNGNASDERLKENIVPLEQGLETVEQIETYKFNYKDRPQDTLPGVIAQEIEKLIPEVVYDIEMEDDTYKAVRYQQIVPVLINAIKDLSLKVKDLENRLNNDE